MLGMLAAHKPSRLIFAVTTLAIAIAGVVANYALSHDAIRAFQQQLALKDSDQFLLTGRLTDATPATRGRHDATAFEAASADFVAALLPLGVQSFALRSRSSQIDTEVGPRPVRLVQASREFLLTLGAAPLPPVGWNEGRGLCVVGRSLAERSLVAGQAALSLDGRACEIAGVIELPELPHLIGLNEAVFVARDIGEFATDLPIVWSVHLHAAPGTLDEAALRNRLSAGFDLAFLEIWSGAALVARAERLIAIVRLVTNGLGLVILLVGGASIASLMSFSVAERAREIAVKRTIGASRRQILQEIVAEALLIGLIACLIGAAAGWLLALHLKAPLAEFFALGLQDADERLSFWPMIKAVAQFLALCALAGAAPGWRAANRDPAQVLRAP